MYFKKKRQHEESRFQQQVVAMLRAHGVFCFSVPNGAKRKETAARIAKAEGLLSGVADLIILLSGGRTLFVEFKNPNKTGTQFKSQREFQKTVKTLGFSYVIWDNWIQVQDFINSYNSCKCRDIMPR